MCVILFLIIDHFHKAKLCSHLHFSFLNVMIFLICEKKIYLWSKVIFLFCLYLWDAPNQDASDCVLDLFWKLSRRRGASAWFHGIWTCGVEVLDYWTIFHWQLNKIIAENFGGIGMGVCLWCCWKDRWSGFNGIYLVRFGFRMLETLISAAENSNKFQKNTEIFKLGT